MTTKGKADAGTASKIGAAGGLIAVVATGLQFGLLPGIAVFGGFLFFLIANGGSDLTAYGEYSG